MGGKTWSKEEEEVFWKELIPHSPKRLGKDLENNREQTWNWVAKQMTERMGENARRQYTHLSAFEHYFQNTYLGRFSPKAGKLPMKYYKHEQAQKKAKEESQIKREEALALANEEEALPKKEELPVTVTKEEEEEVSTPAAAMVAIKTEAYGGRDQPIEIDCQYTTLLPYHAHVPNPRFTRPSAPSSFDHPDALPARAQHHSHSYQFLANHGRLDNLGAEDDSPFVHQPPASWMDPAASFRGHGFHQY